MAVRILLTGFEPFGNDDYNPSAEAVERVSSIRGARIEKLILPVVWGTAFERMQTVWEDFSPDLVLMTGLAGGSDRIRIERVGINLCGAAKDSLGKYPNGSEDCAAERRISENGADAYFSTYDEKSILNALRSAGIPAGYSSSAGTYLCNYILYSSLEKISKEKRTIKAGFLHVPYANGMRENVPCLPIDIIVAALELALSNML